MREGLRNTRETKRKTVSWRGKELQRETEK
jgi:hypothetical protein